jgi:hypothetical protein
MKYYFIRGISSWKWGRVRTDVSEEHVAFILMVKRIGERETVLAVEQPTASDVLLRNEGSHKTYTTPHLRDGIVHSPRRENLKP